MSRIPHPGRRFFSGLTAHGGAWVSRGLTGLAISPKKVEKNRFKTVNSQLLFWGR